MPYLQINQAFCNLIGYSEAELLQMRFLDLVHPDDVSNNLILWKQLITHQIPSYVLEKRCIHKNGQFLWMRFNVSAVYDSEGTLRYIASVIEDITQVKYIEIERQEAEKALRRSEERFRSVFDQIEIGMAITDLNGRYVQVNSALCNLVGYSETELLQLTFQKLTYSSDQEIEAELMEQLLDRQIQTYSLEKRYLCKNGQLRWVNVHISEVLDEAGMITFFAAMVEDISDRKQAEEALRRSEARNQAMISAIPDLLICMDKTGRYLDVVEGQTVQLLKPTDGFDNKTVFDILPQYLAQQRMSFVQEALKTGQTQVYEHQIEIKGGVYDEEIRIAMISENEVLVIVRDISDRKRSEIERNRATLLLQQQANREQALNHVTQAIRNSLDLTTIFSTAVLEISTLLQLDRVCIVKWFPDQGYWQPFEEHLRHPDQSSGLDTKIPDEDNPVSTQLKQGKIVKLDDASIHTDAVNQSLAAQIPGAWLLIPLEVEGKVWGNLSLVRSDIQVLWQDTEVDLACAVADQLAIAIQQSQLYAQVQQLNTHLEEEVQQRTAQLQQAFNFEALLKRITDKVRDSLDEDQILQAAVDELGQGLQVECSNAALYDPTLTAHTITHEYSISQRFALGQTIAFANCPTIEIFDQLIQNISLQFCLTVTHYAQPDGQVYAILACPMLDDQGILGDLWLYKPKHECFNDLEIRLVQQVANQCAIALRQSRLYQAAQFQVQELERLNGLKDDFLSTVSHELRTPMANIKMATQMLEISLDQMTCANGNSSYCLTPTDNRCDRYLQILKDECQRETRLINDLLDLSRLDSGSEPLMPLTHCLQYWLPHVAESFAERTHSQQQQFWRW